MSQGYKIVLSYIFDMKKINSYVRGLKPSIPEQGLKELRPMPPNVRSNIIEIRHIEAEKGRSQRGLMKQAQPRQQLSNKTNEKGLPTYMLGDTPDAPSARSTLPKEHGPDSQLHSLDSLEFVLKQGEVLLPESILFADDLHQSLQQHDLSSLPLLQSQQQVGIFSV